MTREEKIIQLISKSLEPSVLKVENESDNHAGPSGRETHFKIIVVSEKFEDLSRLDRRRKIHELLDSEFKVGLHAITLQLLTSKEAETKLEIKSPGCAH